MSERPGRANAAVLVGLDFGDDGYRRSAWTSCACWRERRARAVRPDPGQAAAARPGSFAGSGKVEEIAAAVREHQAAVVIFNHELSPAQQRNLERKLECPVLDRTGLILDIFARRARSHEGKLQVELAQLRVSCHAPGARLDPPGAPAAAASVLRGPGRNPDRNRPAPDRQARQAAQGQAGAVQAPAATCSAGRAVRGEVLSVSLVGYTNAGKSHAVQRADPCRQPMPPTSCSPRWTPPRAGCTWTEARQSGAVRHRGFHPRPAAQPGGGLSRHAGGDRPCRSAAARGRCFEHRARRSRSRPSNAVLAEIGADAIPQVLVWNKIDLTAGFAGIGARRIW